MAMTIHQELELIQDVISGNTQAYACLVDRYKDLVFTLALRMMKHREEAEEVAQDTFVKVFKSLNKFKGDSKFSTWMYRITYNTCLDRIKSNKMAYREVEINEFTERQLGSLENALEQMIKEERETVVKDCIAQLPDQDSFLMTLYYYEDLSLDEMSQIVNMTPNHIKVKLFRSRKKLASILKANLEPEVLNYYER